MRTSNPALSEKAFKSWDQSFTSDNSMTVQGTVNKTAFLVLLLVLAASKPWYDFFTLRSMSSMGLYMGIGGIGAFLCSLVIIFKKTSAPYVAPIHAALEGLFIGAISAFFEARYPGIVIQAIGLTFGTLIALLAAYTSGLIKVTEKFKLGIIAATGGIFLVYMASFVLGLFNVQIPYIHGSGLVGILFSGAVVIIAALNLVLDFDFIENGAKRGAPKFMEWYAAFGLMVTLVWLYLEILKLLSKLQGGSRD